MIDSYAKRFPKAVQCLEDELEDSLAFYAFPMLDARKISFSNMIERLNREIRRRTRVVGIFPNESSYVRLVTTYLMEYAEDRSVSRAYISFIFQEPFCELYLTRSGQWLQIAATQNRILTKILFAADKSKTDGLNRRFCVGLVETLLPNPNRLYCLK